MWCYLLKSDHILWRSKQANTYLTNIKLSINQNFNLYELHVFWLVTQVAERHDNIVKLRNENRDIEEKLREALASASHRGEVIKQLRDEIKQYQGKVRFFFTCNW